jgi:hypothetical protein
VRVLDIPKQWPWLASYVRQALSSRHPSGSGTTHVLFCLADHFEPGVGGAPLETMVARVERWVKTYPRLAATHRGADGVPPRHTFFFPEEQYHPDLLDRMARLVHDGWGEVEVHLHHDADSSAGLRDKIERFKTQLVSHGLLSREPGDRVVRYGFIHGNWALDNSAENGRWCGVNGELRVLRETGCYADFTLPSAPSETQTRKINAIYYATSDPDKPKSHDGGSDVRAGGRERGDLMLIQGPLALDWSRRKFGLVPRLEAGALTAANPGAAARARLWVGQRIHVHGRPEWVVVKVHAHGADEEGAGFLLEDGLQTLWTALEAEFGDASRYQLHYVTARELYNIVKAAEEGLDGDPSAYRDHRLKPLS